MNKINFIYKHHKIAHLTVEMDNITYKMRTKYPRCISLSTQYKTLPFNNSLALLNSSNLIATTLI